ncbi:MAG: metal-dependent phosphohydrolase [Actinomycetota bacterium]
MANNETELWLWWQRFVGPDRAMFDAVISRHREAHRRYHTETHVAWVLRHCRELLDDPPPQTKAHPTPSGDEFSPLIVAAAFWHDAVYDPTSATNEQRSAQLAARDLGVLGWDQAAIGRVVRAIEGTAHHLDPADEVEAVLFDADLAVLGADPRGYRAYVDGVRFEYRHVADDDWRVGRAAVLRGFLGRDSIYATVGGRRRWQTRAVANLTAELVSLN